jgi:hypothetical protein
LDKNIYKLIGSKGVVQGKIFVFYSSNDKILEILFRMSRIGERAVGLRGLDYGRMAEALKMWDSGFAGVGLDQIERYVRGRVENINVGALINGHLDYRTKMWECMKLIDFGTDEKNYRMNSG